MLKLFAASLIAISMLAGAAHAAVSVGLSHHKYWPACPEGAVKATCTCRAGGTSHDYQLCHIGQWCHVFTGVCTR